MPPAVVGRCHPGGEDFVLNAVTTMLIVAQRMYSYRFQLFRLGSLSATISILKIFLMVLTMKIEEVKKRIGLFGLEDSQFTDNLLLIEELSFRINDVGNSDA